MSPDERFGDAISEPASTASDWEQTLPARRWPTQHSRRAPNWHRDGNGRLTCAYNPDVSVDDVTVTQLLRFQGPAQLDRAYRRPMGLMGQPAKYAATPQPAPMARDGLAHSIPEAA